MHMYLWNKELVRHCDSEEYAGIVRPTKLQLNLQILRGGPRLVKYLRYMRVGETHG